MGLMAEVNASFQQLAHAVVGQRHISSPVDPPRTDEPTPYGRAPDGFLGQGPRVKIGRLI